MARATMTNLIAQIRRMIGDRVSPYVLSDDDIQAVLDDHRFTVRYQSLIPAATLSTNGVYTFLDYYTPFGGWEDDYSLQWGNFAPLSPTLAEPLVGHWAFTNPQPGGQFPPVFITGKYYDLHAAAADCLEMWATSLSTTAYAFTSDGQSFQRNQIITNLLANADRHRAQAFIKTAPLHRTDIAPVHEELSITMGGIGDDTSE